MFKTGGNFRAIERSRSRRLLETSNTTLTDISIDSLTADDLAMSPANDRGTKRTVFSSMEEATQAKSRKNNRPPSNIPKAGSSEELLAQLNAL